MNQRKLKVPVLHENEQVCKCVPTIALQLNEPSLNTSVWVSGWCCSDIIITLASHIHLCCDTVLPGWCRRACGVCGASSRCNKGLKVSCKVILFIFVFLPIAYFFLGSRMLFSSKSKTCILNQGSPWFSFLSKFVLHYSNLVANCHKRSEVTLHNWHCCSTTLLPGA